MNTNFENVCEMQNKIKKVKEEKNILVLAHYYQDLAIQDCADFCGDSFELAKIARSNEKHLIVFCGVKFMAESAKIMNPEKRVFLPRTDAGCPMADMVTPEIVLEMKKAHPNALVVCYINSSSETKAISDICVTSSNALKVVSSLDTDEIIFVPDKNLGNYVSKQFPDKKFYFHNGFCPTHKNVTASEVIKAKEKYPDALLTVHPECEPEVVKLADHSGSTKEILEFCRKTPAKRFLVGTEISIVERLAREMPQKEFILLSPYLVCPNMKKTELSDLLYTLENLNNEIFISKEDIKASSIPLERMLAAAQK